LGKKQAKRKRFLKRMKSRGKWKHGRSNVEKVRRLEEARALARARALSADSKGLSKTDVYLE